MKHWTLLGFTTAESQKSRRKGQLSLVELALQGNMQSVGMHSLQQTELLYPADVFFYQRIEK